jgi:hypothetical protein
LKLLTSTLVALALEVTQAAAQEPRAFVCKVQGGITLEYEGSWRVQPNGETMEFTLAALDVAKGTAQFIGNAGAESVWFLKGNETWNFVEITGSGNVMTTTVYASRDGRTFPMIHSRHPSIGGPIPSQNRGVCMARF